MNRRPCLCPYALSLAVVLVSCATAAASMLEPQGPSQEEPSCKALAGVPDLTILSAGLVGAKGATPQYCYVRGFITPDMRMQEADCRPARPGRGRSTVIGMRSLSISVGW